MKFEPIQKNRISEQIIDQIYSLIISGNLKPGDKMPSERKLSEKFEVSRNSIREAIRILEMLGFLVSKRGDGTYIAEMSEDIFEGYVSDHNINFKDVNVYEAIEARLMVEPRIVRLAAKRRNLKQLQILKKLVENIEGEEKEEKDNANLHFHRMLAQASQNSALEATLNFLINYSKEVAKKSHRIDDNYFPYRKKVKTKEHRNIVKAIEEKDADKAEQLMYEHLNNVKIKIETIEHEKTKV